MHVEASVARSRGEWPWFTGAWLLATAVMTLVPGASEWGEWARPGGADGIPIHEAIRSRLTCHVAHYGASHWFWNVLVLGVTGVLAERAGHGALVGATVLAMLAIPLALALADPSLVRYRGASGIASAWFTLAVVQLWQRSGATPTRAVLAIGAAIYVAKLISEAAAGSNWFVGHGSTEFDSVPIAHVIGTVCGLLGAALNASSRNPAGSMQQALITAS